MKTLTEQNGKTDAFQRGDCLEKIQQNFKYTDKTEPERIYNPITAMGCRQCLSLSVAQLEGKHCRNEVVDNIPLGLVINKP